MKIAIEGCCHGSLDATYAQIAHLEQTNAYKVDLLLICGDFQAVRNHLDLECMAVPVKFRKLGEFWKYYTGQTVAPVLTIVIGGNHEASNYLWELYHGGWLAPNIYFLGHAGCVQVDGIRIAGASGIFKAAHYYDGHHERVPYDNNALRSIYHIRDFNIRRLSLLSSPTIFLSHDWPLTIDQHGDTASLLRRKPFFAQEVREGRLGSPPLMKLLRRLWPRWWFAAHLHVRFEGVVREGGEGQRVGQGVGVGETQVQERNDPNEIVIDDVDEESGETGGGVSQIAQAPALTPAAPENPDEIILDDEFDYVEPTPAPAPVTTQAPVQHLPTKMDTDSNMDVEVDVEGDSGSGSQTQNQGRTTRFLALDKCLPRRDYLEVIDVEVPTRNATSKPISAAATPSSLTDPSPTTLAPHTTPSPSTTQEQEQPTQTQPYTHPTLTFDPDWLAITRAFHPYMSLNRQQGRLPDEAQARVLVERERAWVAERFEGGEGEREKEGQEGEESGRGEGKEGEKKDPTPTKMSLVVEAWQTFWPTAPGGDHIRGRGQPPWYTNPQTEAFCRMLELENKVNPVPVEFRKQAQGQGQEREQGQSVKS